MITFSAHFLILVLLLVASIIDIKTREVPDLLSRSLFALGTIYVILQSVWWANTDFFIGSLISLVVAWLLSMALFLTGQWGGGDVKMLLGISLFMPVPLHEGFFVLPDIALFLFLTMLAGSVFGLLWMAYLVRYNWKDFKDNFQKFSKARYSRFALGGLIFFGLSLLLASPFLDFNISLIFLLLLVGFTSLYYVMIFTKAAELAVSIKKVPVKKVVEGDWIVNKEGYDASEHYGVSNTGITSKEIKMLVSKGIKNVYVKDGVPFLPSFFLGYLIFILI